MNMQTKKEEASNNRCEKWEVSRANWLRYVNTFQYAIERIFEDKLFSADEVDEWHYRELSFELKKLKRFALEAAERLEGYAQKGEIENEC